MTPSDVPATSAREFFLLDLPRSLPFVYHPKAAQIGFASNGWVRNSSGECLATAENL